MLICFEALYNLFLYVSIFFTIFILKYRPYAIKWVYILLYVILYMLVGLFSLNVFFNFYFNPIFFNYLSIYSVTQFNGATFLFLFLAVNIAIIILHIINSKIFINRSLFLINIFVLLTLFHGFFFEKNVFLVFLYYECLLIPSYLLIFFLSPNQRFLVVSIYFLIWTQIGSFLVFIAISYLYLYYGISFNLMHVNFSILENNILFCLIYFGFGIKIPIWPFFYWLTKTHVEAPSFFSIYLSGFLVKTAVLGFYKFVKFFFITYVTNYLLLFVVFSILDSSLKLWIQVDLKKLVAFCTVQEMNLIFFLVFFNTTNTFVVIALFSLTHAFLSALFFYLVDVIYRLYHTRLIFNLTGLLIIAPLLSFFVYIGLILYNGLPFTLKFLVELYTLHILLDFNFYIYINILLVANWLGCIGLAKNWLNILFSAPQWYSNINDLNKKEFLLLSYFCTVLVVGIQLTFVIF